MDLQQLIEKFSLNSSYLERGNPTLAKVLNSDIEDIIKAKEIVRKTSKDNLDLHQVWHKTKEFSVLYKKKEPQKEDISSYLKESLTNLEILIPNLPIRIDKEGHLLVLNLTDLHINRKDFKSQDTLDSQVQEIFNTFNALLDKSNRAFVINKILIVCGHDYFNSDFNHQTTKGTPQTDLEEGFKAFRAGLKLASSIIHNAGQHAPVDFIIVNGNHDYQSSLFLGVALNEIFRNNRELVQIDYGKESRKYYRYENNSLLLSHHINKNYKDFPLIFATEQPKLFAETGHRFILTGHLHSEKKNKFDSSEEYGIQWIQTPSVAKTDKWHDDNCYIGNRLQMSSIILHPQNGKVAEFFEERVTK
jgi:hypothetical protein